jgi:hypothetical protein
MIRRSTACTDTASRPGFHRWGRVHLNAEYPGGVIIVSSRLCIQSRHSTSFHNFGNIDKLQSIHDSTLTKKENAKGIVTVHAGACIPLWVPVGFQMVLVRRRLSFFWNIAILILATQNS